MTAYYRTLIAPAVFTSAHDDQVIVPQRVADSNPPARTCHPALSLFLLATCRSGNVH